MADDLDSSSLSAAPPEADSGGLSATSPQQTAGKLFAPSTFSGAQTYWVSPDQYLSLTPPLDKPWDDPQGRSLKASLGKGEQIDTPPSLEIKDGKVIDQDGRHRALAAKEAGIPLIPVRIKGDVSNTKELEGLTGNKVSFDWAPVSQETKKDLRQPWEIAVNAPPRYEPTFAERMSENVNRAVGEVKEAFKPPEKGQGARDYAASSLMAVPRQLGAVANVVLQATGIPEATDTLFSRPVANAMNYLGGFTGQNKVTPGDVGNSLLALRPGGAPLAPPAPAAVASSPRAAAAREAIDAGYRILPSQAGESAPAGNAMAALSGKYKTSEAFSYKNQAVTDRLAHEALGVPIETPFTPEVFRKIRSEASNDGYKPIPREMPQTQHDGIFRQEVSEVGGRYSAAAEEYPDLLADPTLDKLKQSLLGKPTSSTEANLELIRKLRTDGTANLKAFARNGDPSFGSLGNAQRDAADALDDLIQRNLQATGKPDLINNYKAARQKIAMSHDVESATDVVTGEIDPRILARKLDQGKPLSGKLGLIARTAQAFPEVMRAPKGGANPFTWFDAMLGIGGGLTNPALAGAVLARPAARELLASRLYQNRLAQPHVTRSMNLTPRPSPAMNALIPMLQLSGQNQ